ncbi:hypothetical protein QYE76_004977 [Lolium multiflorum]|uniref:Uncharacterized protein n=1 Tax=Lolium multiflorum TaxID=4521 RepID=A0AAD8W0Q8_LOLMU|nr:hypothetical protein QYE76_004977 [Lolium multiflorum]
MENHYILYLKLDMEDKEVHLKPDMDMEVNLRLDMEVNLRLDMEVMQGHTMLVESEPQGAGKDTIFAELIEEAKRAASDGGTMSRFSLTVKLLQAKSYYRISNVAFNAILLILALQYPTSSIPKSYEEALSIIGRLGLGYDSIHVCPNNCVLFRKDYAKENNCPKCKASRWKDADGRRQIPEKVLRHFPLIPRLQRMFLSKEQSKEVQWHKLKRQDVENDLSHPADGDAWKDFDNIHKDFAADARNIRLGLATDGFNPYGNMSNSYSMWPVFVVPYNLPPWACMDQSNFMLALLIPGPSSPGKDFDVFMEPLMEELQELWKGQVARPSNRQDVAGRFAGRREVPGSTKRPWEPPGSSCCLAIARRWVLEGNTFWHARWDIFCNIHVTPTSEMAEEQITYEDLPPDHKKKYDELKAIVEAELIGSFEKTRSHGIRFKGFTPQGVLEGVDLSPPSDERTRALRQEINYVVAHSLHRHSESLVNSLERVALRVVQEIMERRYSPSGPVLGTHQGEVQLHTRPPLPYSMAAPQQQGSPAYVVYKVGGDPGDYQFLYEPPKEIPHGYVCTFVPDCNNWTQAIQAPTGEIAGAGAIVPAGGTTAAAGGLGAEAEKQAWLAKYATAPVQSSTTSTADQIGGPKRSVRHLAEEEDNRLFRTPMSLT